MTMGNHENKRKTDRLHAVKPSRIQLKGKEYRLNDISDGGVGIIVDGPDTFFPGQRIDAIPLELNDGTIHLKGFVAHISKTESHYICGIRFILDGIEEYKSVAQFKKERTPTK
jgi:hypothetical protein